tara:strand:- start:79 stop:450 length:372 start_codon:yes stop_codon:yes gene_type:complete
MKHTILSAVDALRPKTGYTVKVPYSYESITFLEEGVSMPTKKEVEDKIAELDAAEPMKLLREERDAKLLSTDWTQNPDVPTETKTKWQTYRQALRDLPSTADPKLDTQGNLISTSITWPTKPS